MSETDQANAAVASLHRTFPSVPLDRLKQASAVMAEAMVGPQGEHGDADLRRRTQRLDVAAIEIADIFAAE